MSAETAGQSARTSTALATEASPAAAQRVLGVTCGELDRRLAQGGCSVVRLQLWPHARASLVASALEGV
jgi:hypothetical protein